MLYEIFRNPETSREDAGSNMNGFSSLATALIHLHELATSGKGFHAITKRGERYFVSEALGLERMKEVDKAMMVSFFRWWVNLFDFLPYPLQVLPALNWNQ